MTIWKLSLPVLRVSSNKYKDKESRCSYQSRKDEHFQSNLLLFFFFKRVLLREMSDDDPQGRTPQVDWNMHWKLSSEALVWSANECPWSDIHMKNQDCEKNQNPVVVIWECVGQWRFFTRNISKKACLKIDQLIICRWIESVKVMRVMRAILALDRWSYAACWRQSMRERETYREWGEESGDIE